MKSVAVIHKKFGGPEVMERIEKNISSPIGSQVLLRNSFSGINFIDTYFRTGLYNTPLPAYMGLEGSGVIEEVGPEVTAFKPGDKVVYCSADKGSYSQYRLLPEDEALALPKGIDEATAAASMLKGLTAEYLLMRVYKVKPGDMILVQAAAGGVGLILVQWAYSLGAEIIGTVGSSEKMELVKKYGCHHVINYRTENFEERVKAITQGRGVPVVYDSVGKDTFGKSLNCLSPFGLMVSYGNASGEVSPVALTDLKGSLFLTRPSLFAFLNDTIRYREMASNLFKVILEGEVEIEITKKYLLEEVAQAHRDLEGRKTTGSIVLDTD